MKKILYAFVLIPMLSNAAVYSCKTLSTAPISGDGSVNMSSVKPVMEQPAFPIPVSFTQDVITIFDGMGGVVGTSNWVSDNHKSLQTLTARGRATTGLMQIGETMDGKPNWIAAGFIEGDKFYVTTGTNYVTLASGCTKVN